MTFDFTESYQSYANITFNPEVIYSMDNLLKDYPEAINPPSLRKKM